MDHRTRLDGIHVYLCVLNVYLIGYEKNTAKFQEMNLYGMYTCKYCNSNLLGINPSISVWFSSIDCAESTRWIYFLRENA